MSHTTHLYVAPYLNGMGSVLAELPRPSLALPIHGEQLSGEVDRGVVAANRDQLPQAPVILGHGRSGEGTSLGGGLFPKVSLHQIADRITLQMATLFMLHLVYK